MRDTIPDTGTAGRSSVLLAVCAAAAAMPTAFTGPAVALPAISQHLGGSPVALNWITNAFMLTFGSTLMAAGALADAYGRKRVFLAGTLAFGLVSAVLALVQDIFWLDMLRALQGLGAAAAFSGGMAALAQEFDGQARVRAFSIVGTSFGVGLAFGPIVSGLMIDAFGWRSIFVLVVILAGLGFGLGRAVMRESRDPDAAGLDWPGIVSFTAALTLLTFAVLQAPETGWDHLPVVAMLAGSVLLLFAFVVVERLARRPMLDLSLFRYPRFVGVQLLAAAPAYGFVVLLILLPVRFIGVEGMGQITSGWLMAALSGPLLVLPLAAGLLTRFLAPATICGLGLAVAAAGLLWLGRFPPGTDARALVLPLLTIGVGISLPWGLMDGLAVSVVPKERAGMATGIFSTTRVAGEGVALAVVTALLSALMQGRLSSAAGDRAGSIAQHMVTGNPAGAAAILPALGRAALLDAYGDAFSLLLLVLTVITAVTAAVVFVFLGRGAPEEEAEEDRAPAEPSCRSTL
ncbi:MFS transporter [Rhizobium puerariae]|uniref:MFS transporter n=1 Tax=Rhizobium puerariae TaxID=1585791 RepID=A0ABV6AC01_9HYPH